MDNNTNEKYVDGRIYIGSYKGVHYLNVDFSNIKGEEGNKTLDEIYDFFKNSEDTIGKNPDDLERFLVDSTGAVASTGGLKRLKKLATFSNDGPRKPVKKFAIYGMSKMAKIFLSTFKMIIGKKMRVFNTREEALEWIAQKD